MAISSGWYFTPSLYHYSSQQLTFALSMYRTAIGWDLSAIGHAIVTNNTGYSQPIIRKKMAAAFRLRFPMRREVAPILQSLLAARPRHHDLSDLSG
jgi:hypothetical protein